MPEPVGVAFPLCHRGDVDINDTIELSRLRAMLRSGAARSVRLAAGLSLGDVSRAVGAGKPTILRWETGERTPRGDEAAFRYWSLLRGLMDAR